MLQRGQKITILKSSAKVRSHPNVGDVGYLNNIYLFLAHRFILIDAFFFSYSSSESGHVEKKKFIIDLGMKSNLRYKIAYVGVPGSFFVDDENIVNLSSTGYCIMSVGDGTYDIFLDFPHVYSSCGIWPTTNNNEKTGKPHTSNKMEDRLVKIPFGQIALLSSKSNSKYCLEKSSESELLAWLRTAVPTMASLRLLFRDYRRDYPPLKMDNSCFRRAADILNSLSPSLLLNVSQQLTISAVKKETGRIGYSFFKPSNHSDNSKAVMVKNINLLKSIAGIFLYRLDALNINRLVKSNSGREYLIPEMDYVRNFWSVKGGLLSETKMIDPYKPTYHLIRSIVFRAIFLAGNSYKKLRPLVKCLPADWEANLGQRAEALGTIQRRANNDSSALARIYEVIK